MPPKWLLTRRLVPHARKPATVMAGLYSQPHQEPAPHTSIPAAIVDQPKQEGIPITQVILLEHLAPVTRGDHAIGPPGHLLHKTTPSKLGDIANLPNM